MDDLKEKVVFRKATVKDVHQIVTVNLVTWQSAYKKIMSAELLKRREKDFFVMERRYKDLIEKYNQIYVMEVSGMIVGYISYGPSEMTNYNKYGEVYAFYVLEEYQGNGYGSKLLEMAFNDMKKQGYNDIVITCLWENVKGIDFYKKHGGKIVGHAIYNVYEQEFKDTIIVYNK